MKNFLFICLIYLFPFSLTAQKVSVQVIQDKNASADWQILDGQYNIVFSADKYLQNDTITLGLEINKRYFLEISIYEIFNSTTTLLSLRINNEPIILVNSDLIQGDHFFPFYTGISNKQAKITGGSSALISDFPWQVYYISGNTRCGGAIIDENWILTAAHCATVSNGDLVPIPQMSVKVGANNPTNSLEGKKYFVSDVIVHKGYNSQTLENDIALLKLTEPINFPNAVPIELISKNDSVSGATDPGVMSWLTGWGLTNVIRNTYPATLQKVQLPIISNAQAATVWPNIPKSDIMAGYLNGNKDACMGDSGGPLIVPASGKYKLAGIVSWGSSRCDTYGAYTRVSGFENWIVTNTGIQIGYTPPLPAGDSIICAGTESGKYSIKQLPIASAYEWKLLPDDAGIISGNSENAVVYWKPGYGGSVSVMLRVTIDNKVSEWSNLKVKVVNKPKLLGQSASTEICAGQPVSLVVDVEGYNLNYKWFQNNDLIQSGVSGKLNIAKTSIYDSGNYLAEISGACGTLFSNPISLTVHPVTRINYISPDIMVPFGEDAILEVNAEGHDLNYQWQKDNKVLDNSNVSQYLLQNVNANKIGLYMTTVTGTCGADTSNKVYVYVKKEAANDMQAFLWPTITSDEFNVALSNDEFYDVLIFNAMGQLLRKHINCQYQTTISISLLPRGIYIINVFNKEFRKSIKLIKE